jgi:PPK2 family polyphosphate:nucleotide phosphotransferase
MLASELTRKFCFRDGRGFRLADIDPADTCGLDLEKDDAKKLLASGVKRLAKLQERLYAEDRWSVLVILQGLDTAGKDGVIEHVMSGVNPMGCEVHSFKAPSELELDHDFLWRCAVVLPRRGNIGIFNRSYYEEVLVVRVHPKILAGQRLPPSLVTDDIWQQRFEDINAFERHLARNGTVTLKFFLHLSKEEQRKRLLARIDDPDKRWKFNVGDLAERKLWDQYTTAYEEAIRTTATPDAPWYVVPADHKWFTRLVVGAAIVEQIEALDPKFPTLDDEALRELETARIALTSG